MTPALAILAGGTSSRMGRDKAMLPIDGRTQLERLAGLGAAAGMPVLVCGRVQPEDWRGPPARFLADAVAGEGPLRGLEAALRCCPEVLLIPCDLPLLATGDLVWLNRCLAEADGAVAEVDGQAQPLFCRYRDRLLPRVVAALAEGRRSPLRLIATGAFARCPVPGDIAPRLVDADTREDWHRLTGAGG